jgi:FkbM family methyltransferase
MCYGSTYMKSLPRPLGTLKFLLAWLTPWRPVFGIRAGRWNLAFFAHYRDAVGRHIAKYGTHEPLVTQWLNNYLNVAPPGIVVDVGANLGWHTLHAAQHPNVEAVAAFEPDLFNASLLDRSLSKNNVDKVIVIVSAVGTENGVGRFFRYRNSNYGRHTLITDYGYGSRSVPVVNLDVALSNLGFQDRPISVIKIDVEGYEPAVIGGAASSLTRAEAVIIEYSPNISRAGGFSTDEMLDRLNAVGFTPFALLNRGGTIRLTAEDLRSLKGSLDIIWFREDRATPATIAAMSIRDRGKLTLLEIAEQNKRVVTPL